MNHSGDAAEQIVRMSLAGVEVAARITGSAAKEITLLLVAALKSSEKSGTSKLKLRGEDRLDTMLKSGKPLEIFSVKESDLGQFVEGAKEYGIVYCALRNNKNCPDGLCDIMVKADDAPKINRMVERFNFASVDRAKIESAVPAVKPPPEITEPGSDDKLLDYLMSKEKEHEDAPPFAGSGRQRPPSEPTSDSRKKPENISSTKPSVKGELREIAAARKKDAPAASTQRHIQRGKPLPKKLKGAR